MTKNMAVNIEGSQGAEGHSDAKKKDRVKKPIKVAAWVRSLSSQTASLISVTVCFPLEVIKTRMQIQVSSLRLTISRKNDLPNRVFLHREAVELRLMGLAAYSAWPRPRAFADCTAATRSRPCARPCSTQCTSPCTKASRASSGKAGPLKRAASAYMPPRPQSQASLATV